MYVTLLQRRRRSVRRSVYAYISLTISICHKRTAHCYVKEMYVRDMIKRGKRANSTEEQRRVARCVLRSVQDANVNGLDP